MPDAVDDAYQIFVNGRQLGEFGRFSGDRVTAYSGQPKAFVLPKDIRSGPLTIAIRMWMDSATPFNSPDAGGMHGPPVFGHRGLVSMQVRLGWDDITREIGSGFVEMSLLLLAWVVAVSLYSMDRSESAYLWLSLVCAVTFLSNGVVLLSNYSTSISQITFVVLWDVILRPLRIGLWVCFWAYWFRVVHIRLLHRLVWGLVVLSMVGTAMLRPPFYGTHVPVAAATILSPVLLILKLGFAVLLFGITYRGIQKQKAEGWMAFFAVLSVAVSLYQSELRLLHIRTSYSLAGFHLTLGTISTIFSLCLITTMLLRRFLHSQQRKEQWKAEIEQARQVQHVLIPVELPTVVGLNIESDYRPAREVGGDFFQILPVAEDGSVVIVLGDVTGKGLRAGMLVALIVGAVRTAFLRTKDPLELLSLLNESLCDRGSASATGLILRIRRNGQVTLANAGHLAPYMNGREMEMEGALPLGVVSEAEFSEMHFTLDMGDVLVLMSDGIAEAQDENRNLFGFDRVREMLERSISAGELAAAAQKFGQEDDILVLRVQRDRAPGLTSREMELVAGQ